MKPILLILALICAPLFAQTPSPEDRALATEAAHKIHAQATHALLQERDARQALNILNLGKQLFEEGWGKHADTRPYAAANDAEARHYLAQAGKSGKKAEIIDGVWADIFYLRGYAHNELGDVEAGKAEYDFALELAPAHVMARNGRGNYYTLKREWDKAQADFRHAIEYNFTADEAERKFLIARAQRGLGYILIERGQLDEAEALYKQILADNPEDSKAQQELRYIAEQRSGTRPAPSFLIAAAEMPVGEHTAAWAQSARPDPAQAKTAEEYAALGLAARQARLATFKPALEKDCVAQFGDAHAAACTCAVDKAEIMMHGTPSKHAHNKAYANISTTISIRSMKHGAASKHNAPCPPCPPTPDGRQYNKFSHREALLSGIIFVEKQ